MNFSRPTFSSRRGPLAFTLLEVMVSLTLLTMIVATIYSVWILILKSDAMAQKVAARAQRQRIAIRTVESALICSESFQASLKYYSFVLDNSADQSTLSLTARVPDLFPRNSKFGDANLRRLTFSVEDSGGDVPGKNLVLRQNPILAPLDDTEKQFPLVLAENVKTFAIDCWDTNKADWVQEWDNTNIIPPLVRIRLQMDEGPHSSAPAFTISRLVAMPSGIMPAGIQQPFGGGAPQLGGGPNLAPPVAPPRR
jgi:type II secretory pathway pseudopilin PulG